MKLQAPFPYFGGKSKVADLVWSRFGNVPNYIEPFFGSGAVLLRRPNDHFADDGNMVETLNDFDCHVANFWRSTKFHPDAVADAADRPVSELDLHAIGDRLFYSGKAKQFAESMRADESWCDPEWAGAWAWFVSNWIGGLPSIDDPKGGHGGNGETVHKRRPHLGDAGKGVSRQLPHLGNAGNGVSRQLPHLGNAGNGECARRNRVLRDWIGRLSDRLRNVRCCCGDWSRVCGNSVRGFKLPCGVFLDPPYGGQVGRDNQLYSSENLTVAAEVLEWCKEHGGNRDLRIALCGYEGEHNDLEEMGWECVEWKAHGGMAHQGDGDGKQNRHRERIWFSPGCLRSDRLF